jgi:Ca2+-binding EF-hand superfamily protein
MSLGLLVACISGAGANDKADYERRAAANDMTLFQSLDRDKDGRVTLSEAHGDLNLGPRFDDIDINRDGVVTMEELQRYIRQQYGIQIDQASR